MFHYPLTLNWQSSHRSLEVRRIVAVPSPHTSIFSNPPSFSISLTQSGQKKFAKYDPLSWKACSSSTSIRSPQHNMVTISTYLFSFPKSKHLGQRISTLLKLFNTSSGISFIQSIQTGFASYYLSCKKSANSLGGMYYGDIMAANSLRLCFKIRHR